MWPKPARMGSVKWEPRVCCFGCVCKPGACPGEPFEVRRRGKGQRNVPCAPAPNRAIRRLKYHSQAARESRSSETHKGLPK